MSKFKVITVLIFLFSVTLALAQQVTFDGLLDIGKFTSGHISLNNQVSGYYNFYQVDKIDSKNRLYELNILDANLNEVAKKEIALEKKWTLSELRFNGEAFLLRFINLKKPESKFIVLNKHGEKEYSKEYSMKEDDLWVTNFKRVNITSVSQLDGDPNYGIFNISNKGFLQVFAKKTKKMGYHAQFFPNSKEGKKWKISTHEDEKYYHYANYAGSSEDIVLFGTTTKKTANKVEAEKSSFIGINIATGEKVFKKPLDANNPDIPATYTRAIYDAEKDNFFFVGADINAVKQKIEVNGFTLTEVDQEGNIIKNNKVSWKEAFKGKIKVDEDGKIGKYRIYVHKVFKTKAGKIFMVGELYRDMVSAEGIGLTLLSAATGGGGSIATKKIVIDDLVLVELDETLQVKGVTLVDKSKNNHLLDGTLTYVNEVKIGNILSAFGYFDYSFTQSNFDRSDYYVTYIDFDKEKKFKGDKKKWVYGVVKVSDDDGITFDEMPIQSEADSEFTLPAKPGYVIFVEKYKKKKQNKVIMRLEKLNL